MLDCILCSIHVNVILQQKVNWSSGVLPQGRRSHKAEYICWAQSALQCCASLLPVYAAANENENVSGIVENRGQLVVRICRWATSFKIPFVPVIVFGLGLQGEQIMCGGVQGGSTPSGLPP